MCLYPINVSPGWYLRDITRRIYKLQLISDWNFHVEKLFDKEKLSHENVPNYFKLMESATPHSWAICTNKQKSCLNNWAIFHEMHWKVKHDQTEGQNSSQKPKLMKKVYYVRAFRIPLHILTDSYKSFSISSLKSCFNLFF